MTDYFKDNFYSQIYSQTISNNKKNKHELNAQFLKHTVDKVGGSSCWHFVALVFNSVLRNKPFVGSGCLPVTPLPRWSCDA